MTWFSRFRAWLKPPFWFCLTTEDPIEAARRRDAACYQLGFAQGEQFGAARAFAAVELQIQNRRGFDASQDDVDAARRLH